MKRLLIGIAAIAISLTGCGSNTTTAVVTQTQTPTVLSSVAWTAPYTAADLAFYDEVLQLGYVDEKGVLVRAGHEVCKSLDQGVHTETITDWVITHPNSNGTDNERYFATLFIQYSAVHFCPWTEPVGWNI